MAFHQSNADTLNPKQTTDAASLQTPAQDTGVSATSSSLSMLVEVVSDQPRTVVHEQDGDELMDETAAPTAAKILPPRQGTDEDDEDNECWWCGGSGDLVCCDACTHVYCRPCLERNIGFDSTERISTPGIPWHCVSCQKHQIDGPRELCKELLQWDFDVSPLVCCLFCLEHKIYFLI